MNTDDKSEVDYERLRQPPTADGDKLREAIEETEQAERRRDNPALPFEPSK